MTLDQYSLCPCGSGKKIKFCKCAENLPEMIKVDRMIEGEQFVAALDRINTLLKTFPSDAWLLALKCDVLLRLGEYDNLEETSAKFIRLRPDNPLAKIYRSFVALFRGNLEESANLLLQSMADAGENLHSLYLTASATMISGMVQNNMRLSGLLHAEILSELTNDQIEGVGRMYQSIVSDGEVSILLREDPPSGEVPNDTDWSERFREASVLLSRFQVSQAKTKLESIVREFGPVPSVLVAMLNCKLLLADQTGAAQTCQKLADHEGLLEAQRIYFQALAYELAPENYGILLTDELVQYTLTDEATMEAELNAHKQLFAIRQEELRQVIARILNEEVPPKVIYQSAEWLNDDEEARPFFVSGWIALFGKQTDRPARLVAVVPKQANRQGLSRKLAQDLNLGSLESKVATEAVSIFYSALPKSIATTQEPTPEKVVAFQALARERCEEILLTTEFGMLDNKTVQEAASDPRFSIKVRALLLQWLASGHPQAHTESIRQLHTRLGLAMPVVEASDDAFDLVSGAAYFWTNMETIDSNSLIQLMQSALTRNVVGCYPSLLAKCESIDWPENLKQAALYTSYNMKLRIVKTPDQAIDLLEKIYEVGKSMNMVVGQSVLERFELMRKVGRLQEAQSFLQKAITECRDDPVLNEFLNAALYQMQQMGQQGAPGDSLASALVRHRAEESSVGQAKPSGLWTPGSPEPAAPAAKESGSKLWLPGQD